jgi:hypothetical protein
VERLEARDRGCIAVRHTYLKSSCNLGLLFY